ncbi:MAG: class I SAM-dependent methyltransferase [Blautia sp.]|nr:class I SAM-dependent methyltransferase [Blautia sp.]MCM1200872.1 class I SAM-dependent methyltransferase [Bacteroides fragilis]
MKAKTYTDWTDYYTKPKSVISSVTQKITLRYLTGLIRKYSISDKLRVMECGGGNSCFAKNIADALDIKYYDIVDNCKIGIDKALDNPAIRNAWYADLSKEINDDVIAQKYNLVYSVGLVEHFSEKKRKKVIENHFKLCEKKGYVLITAPTPAFQYRFIRRCMELLHLWQFWDESPVMLEELVKEMKPYGEIISAGINRKLPLTQCVVIALKK